MNRKIWGKFGDDPTTSLTRVVQVKIPDLPALPNSNRIAKQIRKNILRDEFGFTDADIEEFDRKYPAVFMIQTDAKSRKWATDRQFEQSRNALPDKIISITIDESAVLQAESFRTQRAAFEVFKVGVFITDVAVRQNTITDLETILNSSGKKRTDALDNLMITIYGSPSKYQYFQALRFLMKEAGYKDNPFLLLALAATTAYRSDAPAFSSSVSDQAAIGKAVQAANESLYSESSKMVLTKISGQEAALINNWAGTLYQIIYADDKAAKRRKIERLLNIPNDERNSLKEGDMISIYASEENVVTVPSFNENQLHTLNKDWKGRQKMEQTINQIGNEIPPTDPRFDEYLYKPDDKLELKDSVVEQKQRVMASGKKRPPLKTVTLSQTTNNLGARADWAGGAVYLLTENWRYLGAARRMAELAEYSGKRRSYSNQIQGEETIIIPPRPEVIKQVMTDIRKYGRTYTSTLGKQDILFILNDLDTILEQSNAFYRTQK